MSFSVKTLITRCDSLPSFFKQWNVGASDLIITNEHVFAPHLEGAQVPCPALFQEGFGSGEPTDEMADAMLRAAESEDYDRVIAIGGGTVIDIAKLFVFGGGLRCEEIFQKGRELPKKRKLIVIPTTCGTGSEVTNISIMEFKSRQTKAGIAADALFPDEAVLIPGMLTTLPYAVFAASSIDALIHAVESYVSPKADEFTRAFGKAAMRLILRGYQRLAASGKKDALPEDMERFLNASVMAGISFGSAGVGAVHALSYPLGGTYHIAHGVANYMMFQAVFKAYRRLGAELAPVEAALREALNCEGSVWNALFALISKILPCRKLGELGIDEAECVRMAESVVQNQQRLLANNPATLSQDVITGIYKSCL